MTILGIDPGTGRTGWGVIKNTSNGSVALEIEYIAHGCVTTSQDDNMPQRLWDLFVAVEDIIKKFSPDCIVIERIFFGRNQKTAITVGQAKGVLMLTAARKELPVFEYTTISVKHKLSGFGRTEKKDMQAIVRQMLKKNKRKLTFSQKGKDFDDAADALAIAIYHAMKEQETPNES